MTRSSGTARPARRGALQWMRRRQAPGSDDRHWFLISPAHSIRRPETAVASRPPCSSTGPGTVTMPPATSWSDACCRVSDAGRTVVFRRAPATWPTPTTWCRFPLCGRWTICRTSRPRHEGAFLAYLRRIVLNAVRDELRRAGRRPPRTDPRRLAAPTGTVAGRTGHRPRAGGSLRGRPSPPCPKSSGRR